jgi:hypothetical protein
LSSGVRTELVNFAGTEQVKTRVADRQFRNGLIGIDKLLKLKKQEILKLRYILQMKLLKKW